MENEIAISKIVIKIGEREEELTVEQARELQDVLNELLGNKEIVTIPAPYPYIQSYVYIPYTPPASPQVPYSPYITYRARNKQWRELDGNS